MHRSQTQKVLRCVVLSASCQGGMWSQTDSTAAAPLGCAVLHQEPRSAPVSRGLGPHGHLGHREKECTDLMMYRKSDEPHSKSQRCHWTAPGLRKPSPLQPFRPSTKLTETQCACPLAVRLHGGRVPSCYSPGCSTSSVTSAEVEEVSVRQDREQEG